jgi:hypothetical protein
MGEFPLGYEKLASATWAYLASLLIIGLFFKFNRFWSIRNLDLILLILLAPGMLMVLNGREARQIVEEKYAMQPVVASPESEQNNDQKNKEPDSKSEMNRRKSGDRNSTDEKSANQTDDGKSSRKKQALDTADNTNRILISRTNMAPADSELMELPEFAAAVRFERNGYLWLFAIGLLLLVRMLLDSGLFRRPLLEPNLTVGGLVFIACSLLFFLIVDVVRSHPIQEDTAGVRSAFQIVNRESNEAGETDLNQHGPGYAVLHLVPAFSTFVSAEGITGPAPSESAARNYQLEYVAKTMAIISQIGVVIGIILIGYRFFGSFNMGVAIATLYLVFPYTAQMTGRVFHVLPAFLLIWAIVSYRRPMISGIFLGLAAGVFYYPLFLLPLWFSFYWERGKYRFLTGFLISLALVVGSLIFISQDFNDFFSQLRQLTGFWLPKVVGVRGIWALGWDPLFRLPALVAFLGLAISFAFWPIRKNLGTLISCTAAIMIALQFCHGFGGGMFIAWYLPLMLLTFFRPNLDERMATNDIAPKWFGRTPAILTS